MYTLYKLSWIGFKQKLQKLNNQVRALFSSIKTKKWPTTIRKREAVEH